MAKELQPIGRLVGTPAQNVSAGNAFETLGQAAGQLGTLVSSKLTAVAVEQAAQKGALDATEGKVPEHLALPFTAATKAYNDAASKIEADRMITSAHAQVSEALVNATNPATFNRETPAQFHATLEGILQGTLENTRPENRAAVSGSLLNLSSQASLKMLEHSVDYDNKQTLANFKADTSLIEAQLKNAYVVGDAQQIKALTERYQDTVANYSELNQQIKTGAPLLKQQFQQQQEINKQLGGYAQALTEGKGSQFLADYMQNKEGLPFDTWQQAGKELLQVNALDKKLTQDIHAEANAQVEQGIKNGSINTVDEINDTENLTPLQKINNRTLLETKQKEEAKKQASIFQAQSFIQSGRSAFVPDNTKKEMFFNSIDALEQAKGSPASLADMSQSILGKNAYPSSGLPGTSMGTNVPAFDNALAQNLTSGDPALMAEASMIYNNMVNVEQQPNTVSLSGKPLAVAVKTSELIQSRMDPMQAAELANRIVLQADQPEVQQRIERFNNLARTDKFTGKSKLNGKFKEVFGTKPSGFLDDAAFKVFKDTYMANYINSDSEEAALEATKYQMKNWGTSRYFTKGQVAQPVPEKEVPIASIGNAFSNQLKVRLQGIINNNPEIEWANPGEQAIDPSKLDDEAKTFGKVGGNATMPEIKINGHVSKVALEPGSDSRFGDRVTYNYVYHDKFGNKQVLPDATQGPQGVAKFSPIGLDKWAPSVLEQQNQDRMEKIAKNIQRTEIAGLVGEAEKAAIGISLPGKDVIADFITFMTQAKPDVEAFKEKLKEVRGKQQESTPLSADNIGIALPKEGGK